MYVLAILIVAPGIGLANESFIDPEIENWANELIVKPKASAKNNNFFIIYYFDVCQRAEHTRIYILKLVPFASIIWGRFLFLSQEKMGIISAC